MTYRTLDFYSNLTYSYCMNYLLVPDAPPEAILTNSVVPLPAGLPERFQRRWNNGHWEVMVEWNIWKFSPPDKQVIHAIKELETTLLSQAPFLGDPELTDILQDIVWIVADKWIIEDHFLKHRARRDFADIPEWEEIAAYTKKISKMRSTFHYLTMLASYLRDALLGQWITPKMDTVSRDIFFLPFSGIEFDEKDFSQKVDFLNHIDQNILQYLRAILDTVTSR